MGIEYAHYFAVCSTSWTGNTGTLRAIYEVLERWGLTTEPPDLYGIAGGGVRKLRKTLAQIPDEQANLLAVCPGVEGVPAIAEIMGPSYYPPSEIGSRYFDGIDVVVGDEDRLHPSNEYYFVQTHSRVRDASGPASRAFAGTISNAGSFDVSVVPGQHVPVPPGFTGFWRGALRLDCGKDFPAIADSQDTIPNKRFLRELESAFGTELVQIGLVF